VQFVAKDVDAIRGDENPPRRRRPPQFHESLPHHFDKLSTSMREMEDGRNIFEPVCFVEAGFVMLAMGKGPCQ